MEKKTFFEAYKMGNHLLKNRVAMAALTRMRADETTTCPNDMHVKYYSERAGDAGFVLTECTAIAGHGNCFAGACGIYSKEHIESWKKVTDAVHNNKGKIFMQVWHCGRAACISKIGQTPYAPSEIAVRGQCKNQKREMVNCDTPISMSKDDIKMMVNLFEQAAKNAKEAGFDGVQLHGANGYLIDEFLRDGTNKRNDEYGGSIENRCRFPLEVIDSFIRVYGSGNVGIKISPGGRLNDIMDSDPISLYKHFLFELGKRRVAFVEVMQAPDFRKVPNHYNITGEEQISEMFKTLKPFFYYPEKPENSKEDSFYWPVDYKPTFIANNNLDYEKAKILLSNDECDMVSFGRAFISNPDLCYRLENGYELTPPDYNTFYTSGEEGYTTYLKYNEKL